MREGLKNALRFVAATALIGGVIYAAVAGLYLAIAAVKFFFS